MSYTARLKLPFIHSGQSQKEVTHNEALNILDILLHPVIKEMNISLPPEDAKVGELYIISQTPEGKFAKHANKIAAKLEYGWQFIVPNKWLEVTLDHDGNRYRFDGDNWLISDNLYAAPSIPQAQTSVVSQSNYLIKKDNGEYLQVIHLEEEVTVQGAYTDTLIQIPHHSIVVAVNTRVLEPISGVTNFNVGIEGFANRYGNNLNFAQDTTNIGLTDQPITYWYDTPIRLTANNGTFTKGKIKITVQLLKPHGPWNWN